MSIGRYLKKRCIDNVATSAAAKAACDGHTQKDIAEAMQVTPSYLSDLLNDRRDWRHDLIEKFDAAIESLRGR